MPGLTLGGGGGGAAAEPALWNCRRRAGMKGGGGGASANLPLWSCVRLSGGGGGGGAGCLADPPRGVPEYMAVKPPPTCGGSTVAPGEAAAAPPRFGGGLGGASVALGSARGLSDARPTPRARRRAGTCHRR